MSRLLSRAREEGIVRISVAPRQGAQSELARALAEPFGIAVHLVAVGASARPAARLSRVARHAAAVLADGDQHNVFVVVNGRAERRAVQIGAQTDTAVQITSGLAAGEVVATTGASTLTDGQSVKAS